MCGQTYVRAFVSFVVHGPCGQVLLMDKILHIFFCRGVWHDSPPCPLFNIDTVCCVTPVVSWADTLHTPANIKPGGGVGVYIVFHYIRYIGGAGFCPSTEVLTLIYSFYMYTHIYIYIYIPIRPPCG